VAWLIRIQTAISFAGPVEVRTAGDDDLPVLVGLRRIWNEENAAEPIIDDGFDERFAAWWEAERANLILNCVAEESSTWLAFTDAERAALAAQDHVALFEMGAHPFLTLTLWIAMFERDHSEPLAMQLDYAAKLKHFALPYPDIGT